MAPCRSSSPPALATITDEEILELVAQLRLSVVSADHQPKIAETANRLLKMLACNYHVQLVLTQETTFLAVLYDLFRGFHMSEAALLSGLALFECLASGPACCKDGLTQCTAWAQPTALLASVVALLRSPHPAVVAAAAKCLRVLSSDRKDQVVCCRVLLQQHKKCSAATFLASIVKDAITAEHGAAAARDRGMRCSLDNKAPKPSSAKTFSHSKADSNSSQSPQELSAQSMPVAAVSKRATPAYRPSRSAHHAAVTLQHLAEAAPSNLVNQKGVISALFRGLGSYCPELLMPCIKAVAALAACKPAAVMLARSSKRSRAVSNLTALKRSPSREVSRYAEATLDAIDKAPSSTWLSMLCQQPKVQET